MTRLVDVLLGEEKFLEVSYDADGAREDESADKVELNAKLL